MKIICSKENMVNGINIVQKAVSSKSTLPILEGILLEAADRFKMTGNDLEIGIECFVDADIQAGGAIVLNSRMFGDIIRRLPDADILIEVKDNKTVLIECENSRFNLKGISADGFPALPVIKQENSFKISQQEIRDMIKSTLFAVSIDENRPILTGSLFECTGNQLNVISIDGFRLALRRSHVKEADSDFSVVVPGKTLNEIVKILQSEETEILVGASTSQILFDLGTCKIVSRLLEGKYLNYNGIIPTDFETNVKLHTKQLLSSIERAALVITSEDRGYPVRFSIDDEKVVITSNTELGNVKEELRIEMDGKKLDLGFNPKYLSDALKAVDEEFIEIAFTTNIGPCIIRPIGGDSFVYMVMPVRTKND